jgi:hypothetical protein
MKLSDPDLAQALAIHHLDVDAAVRRSLIALGKFDTSHRHGKNPSATSTQKQASGPSLAANSHRSAGDCVKKI